MNFNPQYALLFGLAGFAAGAYFIKGRSGSSKVPIIGLVVCAAFTFSTYGFTYAMLTAIEFAVGFGLAHGFIKPDHEAKKSSPKDSQEP